MYSNQVEVHLILQDPVKGKENRHYVKEAECITTKHAAPTLQQKNDDLVPISSDSDMEIVGLMDTSNRSKEGVKKKKRKKMKCKSLLTIDDLINPTSVNLAMTEFGPLKLHYKERSSVRRRLRTDRETDSRSKVISKSPVRRHRSPMKSRSPIRLSRSPYSRHSRSPIHRRSPQRIRSPKRSSPHRNSLLKATRRSSKQDSSPSSRSHNDKRSDVTRLLKKVKLDSNVNRSKEHHSSLKEKLSNMFNKTSKSNINATHSKEKSKVQSVIIDLDADDEEDLALLRQKALETKQKKSGKLSDYPMDTELEKPSDAKDDDQDEEALNLRMIALQSAFVKKHQNRVQRGMKANKKVSRSESPFNQSFLDDIPVPSDELLKFASPPCTPPYDSNYTEDMDLDTDVEREKEKLPYSPTDKITSNVPIDTELLGIEPSDVSFISVNETNSTVFDKQTDPISLSIAPPYYDNLHQYGELSQFYAYPSSQHSSETFISDLNNESELVNHAPRDSHSNAVCDLIDDACYQEGNYPSTGVIHVPDASHALPVNDLAVASISPNGIYSPEVQQMEKSIGGALFVNADPTYPTYADDRCAYTDTQTVHRYVADSSATFTAGYSEPMSLNEPMIPVNVLPDVEASQFGISVEEPAPCQVEEGTFKEPLYMQGVPDVTKDVNKIPTLINRTLVPVPLLRSNKQLQQLLPAMKKRETHPEPTFKSAEMQPVVIAMNTTVTSGSNFKPIKLQPVKKPLPVLTTSVPFDNSMTEESEENDASEDKVSSALPINNQETTEPEHSVVIDPAPIASNNVASSRKKRKRVRKKCKSLDIAQLVAEKENSSCTNDVNKDVNRNSLEREIVEADQGKSNEMLEDFVENRELSNVQNVIGTQEPFSLNFNNIVENGDIEKNDAESEKESKKATSVEDPEGKSTNSHTLINPASSNLDCGALNVDEITKDVDRRQSVEEDEDELRAILLASLKRTTKSDITCSTLAVPVTTSCTPTNTQTSVQQKTSTNITATVNTTCTESNNVSLPSKLNLSETAAKKVNSTSVSSLTGNRKRSSTTTAVKVPLKKLPKKAPIPASTKAVNNAKKYQNMMQRKLNLLKLNNAKSNENAWSNTNAPKATAHASDSQRFVISLGSDTDSDSEGEKRKVTSVTEKQQAQDAVGVDFEKSVQKFLRDIRKEQEQSASVVKPVLSPQGSKLTTQTNKSSSNMHTPLVRRHTVHLYQ